VAWGRPVLKDFKERQGHRAFKARAVYKVRPGCKGPPEHRELLVIKALKERREVRALKVA